jgi:hypothetical protein
VTPSSTTTDATFDPNVVVRCIERRLRRCVELQALTVEASRRRETGAIS